MTPHQSEKDLVKSLGKPNISDVKATSGYALTPQIPKYLVLPASFPSSVQKSESCHVKIIDFGQAFLHGQQR